MFEEYQEKVLLDYQNKKESGQLPNLLDISAALLRQECLNLLKERKNPENDFSSLRTFFGPDENKRGYLKIIDEHPTNKFRALSKFFKGEIAKPDRKNIELLAWLIDFQPRPYLGVGDAYEISIRDSKPVEKPVDIKDPEKTTSSKSVNPTDPQEEKIESPTEKPSNIKIWQNQNIRKAVYAFIAASTVFSGSYFAWKLVDKQCMYWTGDEYQPIACDTKLPEATVVALDNNKVDHLKRITKRDTLTSYSIGKVFYGKINGKIEFYTDSGFNPLDNEKRLLPMTAYILDKYILDVK